MRWVFLSGLITLFLLPVSALAQQVTAEPMCFFLINEAPYKVYGNFGTDKYVRPDGVTTRHRSNFRLEEAGTVHEEEGYPLDRAEFCSYGPFYPDYKLDLTLRTLVPIFDCRTRIDQGPIIIQGRRKPEGGAETKALCFE